ncbi:MULTISPECIES: transposase [Agrobacterium]|uniref:transposase n=1 Tax=Agrobacterium TaxID=357 RepID=UPI0024112433|nr:MULTISPECIES: transposase [Agrobacterium]UHS58227.1 transposase [Agrobacterium vaccinii]
MIAAAPERLEGAPRQLRRRWSEEFKEHAVAEAMEPGASVSAIAHRIGSNPPPKAVCRDLLISFKSIPYIMRYSHFPH